MKLVHNSPEKTFGVLAAWRWLLDLAPQLSDREVLRRARCLGYFKHSDGRWHAVDGKTQRALTRRLPHLPQDVESLAEVVQGLGEIAARMHAKIIPMLMSKLSKRPWKARLPNVLELASRRIIKQKLRYDLEQHSLAQRLTNGHFDVDSYQVVSHLLSHTLRGGNGGLYGFWYLGGMCVHANIQALDRWIARHPNHPVLTIVVARLIEELLWSGGDPTLALKLLRCQNPTLQMFGAVWIVDEHNLRSTMEAKRCRELLRSAGLAPADTVFILSRRLKEHIHARYRGLGQLRDSEARYRYLEKNPERAMGGLRNAPAEIEGNKKRALQATQALSDLETQIDLVLTEMSAAWPAVGVSERHLRMIEVSFVNTSEMRHRLAIKLPLSENRTWLFKRNIDQVTVLIGLKNASSALDKYFHLEEERFSELAHWAASSAIVACEDAARPVGKFTAILLSDLATVVEALLAEPFIRGRQPERWKSGVGRLGAGLMFGIQVVHQRAVHQPAEVTRLRADIIEHARLLLCEVPDEWNSALGHLERLTQMVIHQMNITPGLDGTVSAWGNDPRLSLYPRTLAKWSLPAAVSDDPLGAEGLWKRLATRPLWKGAEPHQMNRMVSVLDAAVAAAVHAADQAALVRIAGLWRQLLGGWTSSAENRWEGFADTLIDALQGDVDAAARLRSEPGFTNSYCRQLLDQRSDPNC